MNRRRDRISELPDPIIHQILSLVPTKEAARTSVLSKRWRYTWTSISTVKLFDFCFIRERFYESVDECMMSHERDASLNKFRLYTKYLYGKRPLMDNWMNIVAQKNVKELDLHLKPHFKKEFYPLPQALLRLRSLTVVKLENLSLENLPSVSLPSLKLLVLREISKLDDKGLETLLLGCPHLEKLLLDGCDELSNPRVSSSTIKSLEIFLNFKCKYGLVLVDAADLRSFVFNVTSKGSCDRINFSRAASIRNVSFTNYVNFDDNWLEGLISRMPLLQSLALDNCCSLRNIKINCEDLKSLYLRETKECNGENLIINAPNLLSFTYEGMSMLNLSIDAPKVSQVNILISAEASSKAYDIEWYNNLIDFLSNLDCAETLNIHVCSEKALIFPIESRNVRFSPLPSLKNLKVKTHRPVFRKKKMSESLGWVAPSVQTLSIEQEFLRWCCFN
ncbi:F-box/LRR-repeat protein At4g14103 [Morus notabilis]|nr:F-box/LRR-repeat protein At4g14103 [Morus notabilis]